MVKFTKGGYIQHYPTRDPAIKEQVPINSRGNLSYIATLVVESGSYVYVGLVQTQCGYPEVKKVPEHPD